MAETTASKAVALVPAAGMDDQGGVQGGDGEDWPWIDLATWDKSVNERIAKDMDPGRVLVYGALCPCNADIWARNSSESFQCRQGRRTLLITTDLEVAKRRSLVHANTSSLHPMEAEAAENLVNQTPSCIQ